MENQLVGVSPWTIIALWFFVVVVLAVLSLLLVSQWRHYKQLKTINNWMDAVGKELDSNYKTLKTITQDLLTLATFVNGQADKTKTNLQLIADKLNEMNGYTDGEETPVVESVQETPVLRRDAVPKEVVEGNETLPNNVIPFPTKKPK